MCVGLRFVLSNKKPKKKFIGPFYDELSATKNSI
jgi:hypothetical protein